MTFPGGVEVSASAVATGDALECEIGKRPQAYRLVPGPWDELLSELAGHGVRLGRIEQVGATMVEPLTIVSSASVARLAREAGLESLDSRRFRSLFELDGCRGARGGRVAGPSPAGRRGADRGRRACDSLRGHDPRSRHRPARPRHARADRRLPRPGRGRRDLLRAVRARGRAWARSCGRRGRGGLSGEAVAGAAPEASGEAPAHRRGDPDPHRHRLEALRRREDPRRCRERALRLRRGHHRRSAPRPAEARAASG